MFEAGMQIGFPADEKRQMLIGRSQMKGITFTGNRTLDVVNFSNPTPGPRDVILSKTSTSSLLVLRLIATTVL